MAEGNGSGASLADFIWRNAEDLWGDFKHTDFGKVILPFTLLRRLECVLEKTRKDVAAAHEAHRDSGIDLDLILRQITRYPFYNTSGYTLATLGSTKTRQNLQDYVARFSDNARVIFEQFDFTNTITRLDKAGLLYKICKNFAGIDLHPDAVPDRVMSNLYEHLIRTLYDPTCGTGGFLSDAMSHVAAYGAKGKAPPVLVPYGQELEPEPHAVCLAGRLLRTLETDRSRDLSKNIAARTPSNWRVSCFRGGLHEVRQGPQDRRPTDRAAALARHGHR